MPTPSSPLLPAEPVAAPPTLSSPLAQRVGVVPAVLFLASLGAVVYLVRVGVLPPWSLAGLALWVAPSALFSELSKPSELGQVVALLSAHHQALSSLVSLVASRLPPTAPAALSLAVVPESPSTPLQAPEAAAGAVPPSP